MAEDDSALLQEQVEYYRARAAEYDRAYTHRADVRELLTLFDSLPIDGDVLEMACGTGQWTRLLATRARSLTALDASPEMLAIARERTGSVPVDFREADLFSWQPSQRYDTVFFGFWLSHVPPSRWTGFWDMLASALTPQGRVVFVDNSPGEAAGEEILASDGAPVVRRQLDDGSEHRVVKVFHDPARLAEDLASRGWTARIQPVGTNFLTGVVDRVRGPEV